MISGSLHSRGNKSDMQEVLDSMFSYVIALGALLMSNSDHILTVGGLVLLVLRLMADAPRAYNNVKGWLGYGKDSRKRRRSRRTPL